MASWRKSISYIGSLWAKTAKDGGEGWHPLILHMLDVAASADVILAREPETTRQRMAAVLGLSWEAAKPWLLVLIACHDLGKACSGFQLKWEGARELLDKSGLRIPPGVDTSINHAYVSQVALAELLQKQNWPFEMADLAADAVGCHHGERANPITIDNLMGNRQVMDQGWADARRALFKAVFEVFQPSSVPSKNTLSGPDFMLISGLTSFADWIGSNEAWFIFGTPADCNDLGTWWDHRSIQAEHALDAIGWQTRSPLSSSERSFNDVFSKLTPRPLQQAVSKAVHDLPQPCIILVEAPMGEGKTEAAFYAHLELQRRFGHRGMYVALPTKATGNAMFARTLEFLHSLKPDRTLDLQLLHGGTLLNDTFQNLKLAPIYNPDGSGQIRAGEWFTNKKRALLSEYGVGTVDQALMTILPVRHNFVRLWGLANRVVVFDEIHAYDDYTGTLLIHLCRWLLALGSSVMLLSATLPPSIRRKLADVMNTVMPESEVAYPRLTIFNSDSVGQIHFEADPTRRQTIHLQKIAPDLPGIKAALDEQLSGASMGLVLLNTVQRAQDLYQLFPGGEPLERQGMRVGKRLPDGTEVFLFHARFPADRRQKREDAALSVFGREGKREGRKILIATQVAEQSLDLDFDLIITDLAPIDLILQRAGRLWRHARESRALAEPCLLVAGLAGEVPPSFDKPLWWGAIYREDLLLRTWCLLQNRRLMTLPDEIDTLVDTVYEERGDIPKSLQERLDKTIINSDGKGITYRGQANQAIIGFPDDASWNDPARFVLYDEDDPGVHRTLMARTRLDDGSIIVIPIFGIDSFEPATEPDFAQSKMWFQRSVSLSRKGVVIKLRQVGVPEGWEKSSLLRNCYPLRLDPNGCWLEDSSVRLDDDLGLVYTNQGGGMGRYNLIDEKWIPVRFPDGTRDELGISETLLRAKEIAAIEDPSPLVVAALHRFLLALLYRALEGPTDIEQAKALFKEGLPGNKIAAYLEKCRPRFCLFDEKYPFYQVPNYAPKEKNGKKQWRTWTAIAAEHNADNAKVLFDHVEIEDARSIPSSKAALWLIACQTFALGGGNSDFQYTKSGPSATALMVLPLGENLHDTLLLSLIPENREVLKSDLPMWEREPDALTSLQQGTERNVTGLVDLYSWRTRAIRFNPKGDGLMVGDLVFASGVGCSSEDYVDPMLGYRIDEKKGKLPIQFRDRGLWRDFDSLLPDEAHLAPQVIEHATALTRAVRSRLPRSVMVLGQANSKAKIEYWRMERFALPSSLAASRFVRSDIRRFLDTAEEVQKQLWAGCGAYARDLLSRGERKPDGKDVKAFIAQMPCIPCYWSTLEAKFHEILLNYTLDKNPDEIELEWLEAVRCALNDAWKQHRASVSMGDAWAIRAVVKAEAPVERKLKDLDNKIEEFKKSLNEEGL